MKQCNLFGGIDKMVLNKETDKLEDEKIQKSLY